MARCYWEKRPTTRGDGSYGISAVCRQVGRGDKPLSQEALAGSLPRSGILRIGIEEMPIVLHLVSSSGCQKTELARQRLGGNGIARSGKHKRMPGSSTWPCAGARRGCVCGGIVEGQARRSDQDCFRCPVEGSRRNLNKWRSWFDGGRVRRCDRGGVAASGKHKQCHQAEEKLEEPF